MRTVPSLQALSFALAVAAFSTSVLAAVGHAVVMEGRLPPISLEYLAEADRDFEAGNYEAAAARYAIAAAIAPDDDQALYRLGTALHRVGDLGEGIRAFRSALRLNPRSASTHYNLAIALAEQGELDAAIRHNRIVLHLNPAHVEARTNLAAALLKQGRVGDAIRHYEMALRLRPGFPPAAMALASLTGSAEATR